MIDVTAEGVSLRLGGRAILTTIDLRIGQGTLLALTGPSGSGKTSLLTILAGQQAPTTGIIRYDGEPSTARTHRAGEIQLVHQSFGLLSLLTATENVELALRGLPRQRRSPRAAIRAAALSALGRVGLGSRATHLVDDLSGGEQQRVALARAIVTAPRLLLADEPTARLDADNRHRTMALLRELTRAGTTVVVATHDTDLAADCDREIHLLDGHQA